MNYSLGYTPQYLREAVEILTRLDHSRIERILEMLLQVRNEGGRIFFLGVGGGAGHASHAVNDFRKIAGIECYAPTDNVSELTARINDDGWETSYLNWLKVSHLKPQDAIFIFSVGGGNAERNISMNLVCALKYAREVGSKICGIVGRDGGFTAQISDACVLIPVVNEQNVTPHTESFQALIWHLLVSHPDLRTEPTKWETLVQ